ncbi:MAG: undecaprenyl-diphosphate phosphatase, partial [Peptococcaceae bacterium]|nr:undecaprenyl-diphosphate phosphatase [Peptococcaceae bacterium]
MTLTQALVLGLVQGLGEFLPISSSAHLILTPWILNWQDHGLVFDVALHMGTLVAVLAFFWQDWIKLSLHGLSGRKTPEGKMFWYLVVATIPGVAFGLYFEEYIATVFRNPLLIGIMLILMGVVLYIVDRSFPANKSFDKIGWGESIWIGISQAFAMIPGVSRSGITMTAGRVLGLNRETAARFSFLLSTPIIVGASLMQGSKLGLADITIPFIGGITVSAVVGYFA